MDMDDTIVLLAAAPATAYREYLYRPGGQFARWDRRPVRGGGDARSAYRPGTP